MYPIVFLECPMHAMNKNLKKAEIYVQLYTIIYSICIVWEDYTTKAGS